jgi:hypothetical protein
MKPNIIITTNEKYIWELITKARQGKIVRMIGMGKSMRPLLEGGRDYIDLVAVDKDTQLKKNDIIFYKSYEDKFVLHRIFSVSEEGYYPNGDGNLNLEPLLKKERIYLKAVGFVRKGKYVSTDSKGYQLYVKIWTELKPRRSYLLRWHNRLCKMISTLKKE